MLQHLGEFKVKMQLMSVRSTVALLATKCDITDDTISYMCGKIGCDRPLLVDALEREDRYGFLAGHLRNRFNLTFADMQKKAAEPVWLIKLENVDYSYPVKTLLIDSDKMGEMREESLKYYKCYMPQEIIDDAIRVVIPLVKTEQDIRLYQIFGPPNPIENHCCGFDGCRMLICACREFDYLIDEEASGEWFTGSCDCCRLQISDISHSVRYPAAGGGWEGCFCSEECLRKASTFPDSLEDMRFRILFTGLNMYGIHKRQ